MAYQSYSGRVAALATKHAKDEAIAPIFRDLLGIQVQVVNIDTDSFGTFTGDIPRTDSPLNTAIAKARAGMTESGHSLGLASEGTIGPDPFMPFFTADIETIVFIDDERGIVVSETIRSTEITAIRETVAPDADLTKLLASADFPRHGLIVRPPEPHVAPIAKGITDKTSLLLAIRECASHYGTAVVESDLRACYSPSRMRNIQECATRLAERIGTPCPECAGPGWGRVEPVRGLPCSACGTYVETAIRADVFGCPGCPAVREVARSQQTVEPRWCPRCNP
jgi:hypothetical protein